MTNKINRKKVFVFFTIFLFLLTFIPVLTPSVSAITISFGSINAQSSSVQNVSAVFNTARNSTQGSSTTSGLGGICNYDDGANFRVYRVYLRFSTAQISDTANVTNATLKLNVNDKGSGSHLIYVLEGGNAGGDSLPEPSNVEPDFSYLNWGVKLGQKTISALGDVDIYLNENLSSAVNLTGNTTLYLVYSTDYNAQEPTTDIDAVEISTSGARLEVTYINPVTDYSDYCYTGDIFGNINLIQSSQKFHEGQTDIEMNTVVRHVDMPVHDRMYDDYSNPASYHMVLNGNKYAGDEIVAYNVTMFSGGDYVISQQHLVRWNNLNLTLDNEKINIAFGIYSGDDYVRYTYPFVSKYDINNDGHEGWRRWHSDTDLFENGVFDGTLNYEYEIAYRIWHDCIDDDITGIVYEFENDTVFISPNDDGSLVFDVGDPVDYIVYSQDMSAQPYIYFNKDESNQENKTMTKQSVKGTFVPNSAGSWNISLVRGGAWKAGVNFTVNAITGNYIYSDPSVTRPFGKTNIYYNYTSVDGYNGCIKISTSDSIDDEYVIKTILVDNGTSGSVAQTFTSEGTYYLHLCAVYPNNVTYSIKQNIHYCYNTKDNSIVVHLQNPQLSPDYPTYQTYRFSHNYVGWDVTINENGVDFWHVGGVPEGDRQRELTTAGYRNVTLELLTNDGWIILAVTEYTVTGSKTDQGDTGEGGLFAQTINQYLNDDQQLLLALFIIIICALLPAMFAKKYEIKNLPVIIYLVCAIMGFGVSIYLELLPEYLVVLFAFALSSITVINILGNMGYLGSNAGSGYEDNTPEGEQAEQRTYRTGFGRRAGRVRETRIKKAKRRK